MSGHADREAVRRYRRRSLKQDLVAGAIDLALALFFSRPVKAAGVARPKRLLISNFGHLGDLLMMGSVVAVLREAFPGIHIGLLCGSWARPLVQETGLVDQVHYLDHWHLDRRSVSWWRKLGDYLRGLRGAAAGIRAAEYDTAVALRPWWPNAVPVLWAARIPVRLGYRKGGFSTLLTHRMELEYDRRHELGYQIALLQQLPVEPALWNAAGGRWMAATAAGLSEVSTCLDRAPYAVLHPGASIELKNWTEDGWRQIARRLVAEGLTPVFTGLGSAQADMIRRLTVPGDGCVNLCDRLSWEGLAALVDSAEVVYCVDTSIGHLASALGVPCVAILGGMHDPLQWRPAGPFARMVSYPVDCNPCFNQYGCSHMSCLRKVSAEEVWKAGGEAIESRKRQPRGKDR